MQESSFIQQAQNTAAPVVDDAKNTDAKKVKMQMTQSSAGFGPADLGINDNDKENPNVYHEPAHTSESIRSSPPGEPIYMNQAELKRRLIEQSFVQESPAMFGPADLNIQGHTGENIKKDAQAYEKEGNDAVSAPPDETDEDKVEATTPE